MTALQKQKFQTEILSYFKKHGRVLPWRETTDPYHILISEVMLQQTQVPRVEEKYKQFIKIFPTIQSLANAPIDLVYSAWKGLGYNRRALSLKKAAQMIVSDFGGNVPKSVEQLNTLPGIGKATAASIMAFGFDAPVPFIETNVRTVFIHFFFKNQEVVTDDELFPLVEQCLYVKSPRVWYSAIMDYGTMLKKNGQDKNKKSAHYVKQSKFQGSMRQLRGKILKLLSVKKSSTPDEMMKDTGDSAERVDEVIAALEKEGFIKVVGKKIRFSSYI